MARRAVAPEDMALYLGSKDEITEYKFVDCLTQSTVQRAIAAINTATICENSTTPGALTISVPFQGVPYVEVDADKASAFELSQVARAKEVRKWKLAPAEPKAGDIIYDFEAYLSSFDNGMQADAASTMSGQLEVTVSTYEETIFEEEQEG